MCRDCSICGVNRKVNPDVAIEKGFVTFNGDMIIRIKNGKVVEKIYPIVKCNICGCSWIADVGGFEPKVIIEYLQ